VAGGESNRRFGAVVASCLPRMQVLLLAHNQQLIWGSAAQVRDL